MRQPGQVFIVSAASGTGKTTLVSRLTGNHPHIQVSISYTTRMPRGDEKNGVNYHFVDTDTFQNMIKNNVFLEYAFVHNHYYGTSSKCVQELINQGIDVILEIDTQGAEQVRRLLTDACSIFILPPSFASLSERLIARDTDSPAIIKQRLDKARNEIEQAYLFDYVIINDDLDTAEQDLLHIIKSRHLQQKTQCNEINRVLNTNN